MRTSILFLAFACCLSSFGQTTNGSTILPQLIPQTPQAAAFARYGEYPISPATGVPEISIPLYTIECGDIKLPISISYHASGIKVEDIATPVGLGWTLNFGGSIVVERCGSQDDGTFDFTSEADIAQNISSRDYDIYQSWTSWINDPIRTHFDTQSDRYIYNFGGKSGVFRYNTESGELTTIPYSPIRIEKTMKGFKISDTDGLVYYFEKSEFRNASGMDYFSAYYLTRIESLLSNNIIELQYVPGSFYHQYIYYTRWGIGSVYEIFEKTNPNCSQFHVQEMRDSWIGGNSAHWIYYYPVILKKIIWKNNKLEINYATDRLDKYKDRITDIQISSNDAKVKSFIFDNNRYFGSNSNNYRMKLNKLTIQGLNPSIEDEVYQFSYNPTTLPDYHKNTYNEQNNTDYWGYQTKPSATTSYYLTPIEFSPRREGVYKEPNETLMQACILTKIKYPTGGETNFEYEANRALGGYGYSNDSIVGGLRVKKITSITGDGCVETKTYRYSGHINQSINSDMFNYNQIQVYSTQGLIPGAPWSPYDPFVRFTIRGGPSPMYIWAEMIPFTTSEALYSITGYSESPVFYDVVTEFIGNNNLNTGKIVRRYMDSLEDIYANRDNLADIYAGIGIEGGYCDMPRFCNPYLNYDPGLSTPLLTSEEYYSHINNQFILTKKDSYNYGMIEKNRFITGVTLNLRAERIHLLGLFPDNTAGCFPFENDAEFYERNMPRYNTYGIRTFYLLNSSSSTEYTDNGNITTTTNYSYDPQLRVMSPIQTTTTKSDVTKQIETILHPYDFPNDKRYSVMTAKNIVDPIIRKTVTNNGVSSFMQSAYKNLRLDSVIVGKQNVAASYLKYHSYDEYGNPVHVSKDNADNVFYIWSHEGQYPIAKIETNFYSLSDITNVFRNVFGVNSLDALSQSSSVNMTAQQNSAIRQSLPKASVTTFTYKPLVGTTSVIAPNNEVLYYEYDSLGRLSKTYMLNGTHQEVINEYQYNYKNQ